MSWRRKTFDELPALSVRRRDLRSALRTVTTAYVFFMLYFACISGSHVKVYLRMLGFGNRAFGMLSAIPFAATFLLQMVGAILIERRGLKKYQFIHCMGLGRMLWLVVAAVPVVFWLRPDLSLPSPVAVVLMLCILGLSAGLGAVAAPAWMIWMGDLIPRRVRGRFLGNRTRIAEVFRIPLVIAVGLLLDVIINKQLPETAAAQPGVLRAICLIFVLGAVFGVGDVILFYRIREVFPTTPHEPRRPAIDIRVTSRPAPGMWGALVHFIRHIGEAVKQLVIDPMRDRSFRWYVLQGLTSTFSAMVGGWFYWLNAMENLGFSKLATNVMFLVCSPIAGLFAAKAWGRLVDRWGRRPVLVLATSITILSVMPWFLVSRSTPAPAFIAEWLNAASGHVGALFNYPGWKLIGDGAPVGAYLGGCLACIVGGAAWTGVEIARLSMTMGFADGHGRSKYVAAAGAMMSLGGVLGGVVGGFLTQGLEPLLSKDAPLIVGPFVWNNWHGAFVVSLLARMLAVVWALIMPDAGSTRMRDVVRLMGSNVYNNVRTRLFYRQRTTLWPRDRNNRRKEEDDDADSTGS